jgi:hypothetical protein
VGGGGLRGVYSLGGQVNCCLLTAFGVKYTTLKFLERNMRCKIKVLP